MSPCARRWWGRIGPRQRWPQACGNAPAGLAPASYGVGAMGAVVPGARGARDGPAATRPSAASHAALWPLSSPRCSPRAPPVLRIDTTQKADGGTLSRAGTGAGPQALNACDHACPRRAPGGLIPPGLDARARPQGGRHGGRSRDPTACACDRLRLLWPGDGQRVSPHASARLLLGAGGGRHRGPKPLGQEARQGVVNDLAVPIRVAHAPASGATGNPSARRLGSQVTSAWQGGRCDSLQTVRVLDTR